MFFLITMKKLISAIALLLSVLFSSAQNFRISGKVTDNYASALTGAAVSLLQKSDSVIAASAVTGGDGSYFVISTPGIYLLRFSFIGFVDQYHTIEVNNSDIEMGVQQMKEKISSLKEITITEILPATQVKGDTTIYNSDAYKTTKDATAEDLVTKMPGIKIEDGKVQAQGEDVKKVLIDGKPYLGDDPNAALKNLPAEVIDKIQVYDKKSDQSEFTGFDDGNTSKTINIITRPQFRNGIFGRAFGGYGTDEKWKSGLSVNFFKDKRKLTLLGNANNISEQNFSTDDLLGVIGTNAGSRGGGGRSGGSRSSGRYQPQNDAGNFLVDSRTGIVETKSGGFNYVNQWKKTEIGLSYFFNQSGNNAQTELVRQYFTPVRETINYSENNTSGSKNINHRANLKFEYKFDTLNSIIFQPRISFQNNESNSFISGTNNGLNGQLSNAITNYNGNTTGISFSAPVLFKHSFLKKGRTFSVNLVYGKNRSEGTTTLNSVTTYSADSIPSDSLSQESQPDSYTNNYSAEAVYTEPIGAKGQLSFTYRGNLTQSNAEKFTYVYSPADDLYNKLDTGLSNNFQSRYSTQSGGLNYRLNGEKWNMMAGAFYQVAGLKNDQAFPFESSVTKNFKNILPVAMFQYRFTPRKNMRLFYRSSNNSPSVEQLQNVVNNNNPLQLTTGNPELKQDWQNNLNIRFSSANPDKNTSFFMFANGSYTRDYIGSATNIASMDSSVGSGVILSGGSRITRPENTGTAYSFRTFGNYSFPLKAIKSSMNLNANFNYSKTPGRINTIINYTMNAGSGLGFALSSNISDKIDFLFSSNYSTNNIQYTFQENSSNYYSLNTKLKIQVIPWKGLVLQSDVSHQYNSGLSASFNQDYYLLNAAIGYKFLKDRLAELRLSAFDLLQQNKSISRNTTDLYLEDTNSNVLSRYFMLTFTYNLKHFKSREEDK